MARNNPEFDIVVEASILLIVIELWRGDPRAAMIHFSHARLIMDCYTPKAKLRKLLVFEFLPSFLDFFDVFPRPRLSRSVVGVGDFWTVEESWEGLDFCLRDDVWGWAF